MNEKPKVFISFQFFPEAIELLTNDFEIIFPEQKSKLTSMQQLASLTGVQAAIIGISDKLDKASIEGLPKDIRALATYSVGTNHIDLDYAAERNIAVLHTPDVLSESCADTTLLLMLGAGRRAVEGIEMVRNDKWPGWQPDQLLGKDVWGERLGIYGMGRIGQAVAKRARGFGMTIHYHNRRKIEPSLELGAIYHNSLESLMSVSDYFCIACPTTGENNGIINDARLKCLPSGAILVNISRGDLINDEDLISALQSRRIAAAGLDVFANEPNIHPAYRTLDNVFALPHIGSSTLATRLHMARLLKEGINAVLAGKRADNLAN